MNGLKARSYAVSSPYGVRPKCKAGLIIRWQVTFGAYKCADHFTRSLLYGLCFGAELFREFFEAVGRIEFRTEGAPAGELDGPVYLP